MHDNACPSHHSDHLIVQILAASTKMIPDDLCQDLDGGDSIFESIPPRFCILFTVIFASYFTSDLIL